MATDPGGADLRLLLTGAGPRRLTLVRGIVELVAGVLAVLQPAVAEGAIGIAIIVVSLLELRTPRTPRAAGSSGGMDYRRVRAGLGSLVGVSLLLAQVSEGTFTERVVLAAVALFGTLDVIAGLRESGRGARGTRFARGAMFIALAAVLFIVPNVAWASLMLVGAVALIVGGLLTIVSAVQTPLDNTHTPLGIFGLMAAWLQTRDLGADRRSEILDGYTFDAPAADKLTRFTILLGLSAVIAAVGLLANSVAVIIGAMIIAPLMTPILGIGLGIVTGSPPRAMRSLLVTAFGIAFTILLAVAIGSWLATPALTRTPEIIARTSPTILDLVVALAAGAAGAYGASNAKVSDALAGVAISISLVPPLAVVGLLLGQGDYPGASGAMLLFLTNFVSIVLTASVIFVLAGVAPIGDLLGRDSRTGVWLLTFAAGALVLVVPLALAFQATYTRSTEEMSATEAVQAWLPPDGDYQIIRVDVATDTVDVELAGPLDPPNVAGLDQDLDVALGRDVTTRVRVFAAITYPASPIP